MLAYKHSGFSVGTSVRIEAHDRAGLDRLLRYCARPTFSMERLRKAGNDLLYRCAKQRSEPGGDRRFDQGGVNQPGSNQRDRQGEITLTPRELIDRIAALVPSPRSHRHRYYGALAPNSPLRSVVTAMAISAQQAKQPPAHARSICQPPTQSAQNAAGGGAAGVAKLAAATPVVTLPLEPAVPTRSQVHYLWEVLIARIYEVFLLLCPICGGQMRMTAFITHSAEIRQTLDHIGVDPEPLRLSPARGPPLRGRAARTTC